ncbi:MAG: PAS domain-containing sensor histidine kinase [Bacillota bacterium]|nr:PAS domain-containing sensor histidine kinase [Bacillota bacterium]
MSTIPEFVNLDTITNNLNDALFLVGRDHKVIWLNRQAEEFFNTSFETAQNKKVVELTGFDKLENLLKDVIEKEAALKCSYEEASVKVKRLDQRYFFKIAINPIFHEEKMYGALIQLTDVTRFHEMEKIKSDFVSIVSHEFRTPLTTIIVGVEMLKEGMLGDLTPRGKEVLEAIGADCERLSRLIDNLMELSRIESGTIYVDAQPTDVADLVQEAVRPLQIQADTQGVELITDLPPELPPVVADFNKSVWVLANLVGNAMRYTDPGGTITVRVRQKGKRLFFSVEDTGCGIPVEHQEKIFRKYIQVRGHGRKGAGGVGLGLAIAKDIVMAHGGEIWVDSKVGEGTTFTFTFPIYQGPESVTLTDKDQEGG